MRQLWPDLVIITAMSDLVVQGSGTPGSLVSIYFGAACDGDVGHHEREDTLRSDNGSGDGDAGGGRQSGRKRDRLSGTEGGVWYLLDDPVQEVGHSRHHGGSSSLTALDAPGHDPDTLVTLPGLVDDAAPAVPLQVADCVSLFGDDNVHIASRVWRRLRFGDAHHGVRY